MIVLIQETELQAARARVQDEQSHERTGLRSRPPCRVAIRRQVGTRVRPSASSRSPACPRRTVATYRLCSSRRSRIISATSLARAARPGTRAITSRTRWNRSASFRTTMSNGVVVVPSSL